MPVKVVEQKTTSRFVADDYIPALVVIGDERDCVDFIGWYRGDTDLLELQVDPSSGAVCQVTLTLGAHSVFAGGALEVPEAQEGLLVPAWPREFLTDTMCVSVYDDGVSIRLSAKLPARYVRSGDVIFGIAADEELTDILLVRLTAEQVAHTANLLREMRTTD